MEQKCIYQEIDNKDLHAIHLYLKENEQIVAYLRILDKGVSFDEASIGRVISLKRNCGLASRLIDDAIKIAKNEFNANAIQIEAQTYAQGLYEKHGFEQISAEFMEDGIPHVLMKLNV